MGFTIYYGLENNKIDVTSIALNKLTRNNIICIPSDDHKKSYYFSDPVPGYIKSIIIVINNKEYVYNTTLNIFIDLETNTISTDADDNLPEKIKLLCPNNSAINKLKKIQEKLKIDFGNFQEEYPEQVMVTKYLTGNEKVLEIGGNIGRNSLIIASLLTNSKNLVTVECDTYISSQLQHNRDLNNFQFHVENAALSKYKLIQRGWNCIRSDTLLDGYKNVNIISFDELSIKYKIVFDTLVIDCEGAFYYILSDFPEILNNINLLIIENDYANREQKECVDNILIRHGFVVDYTENAFVPMACANCFYQVWVKK